jgi:hypothetical protein
MIKKTFAALGVLAVLFVGNVVATPVATAADSSVATVVNESTTGLTSAQRNAIGSARSYLSITAFSRTGLIDQLKFEGYRPRVATFAVDYLHVNWKRQAYLSAKAYLKITHFSLSGLIEQLRFEGFTKAQATYGAKRAY